MRSIIFPRDLIYPRDPNTPRSPTLPTSTSQTPALPGFGVSGDAKYAWFESSRVSPKVHSNPSKASVSNPSALGAPTGHSSRIRDRSTLEAPTRPSAVTRGHSASPRESTPPFERVQIVESLERDCRCQARVPQRPHPWCLFERVQMAAPVERSPGPRSRCGCECGARLPRCPRSRRLFERVQITARRRPEGSVSASTREPSPHSFERVQTPSTSRESGGSNRPALPAFERVQMAPAYDNFLAPSRPPHRPPRVPEAPGTRPRPTQQSQEENRMHPLK